MPSRREFVNPYNFVPLPSRVVRRRPPGHDSGAPAGVPGYSGRITVEWTLQTPLALPGGDQTAEWLYEQRLQVPGSSVKGAIRSLHEAMFAGCLRVVDGAFLPGYRDPAASRSPADGWRLARVASIGDDGGPTALDLCTSSADTGSENDDVVWVDGPSLAAAYSRAGAGIPTAGDSFTLSGGTQRRLDRNEMDRVASVSEVRPAGQTPIGDRVLLVTDASIRQQRAKQNARCFWAVGRIGRLSARRPDPHETTKQADADYTIDTAAFDRYRYAAAGARDVRQSHHDREVPTEVHWPREGAIIARRAQTRTRFEVGDVLWVQCDDSIETRRVVEFSVAQIWRHTGTAPLSARVPAAAMPCAVPDARGGDVRGGLCLSCEIFGSADTDAEDRSEQRRSGQGRHDSYAGHVRFGPAVSSSTVPANQRRKVVLAPLGEPSPGAGMFYLDAVDVRLGRPQNDLPGQWGSAVDRQPRALRGRKFYWHHDPDAQAAYWREQLGERAPREPRYVARGRQADTKLAAETEIVQPPMTFVQTITVDAITAVGLRSLLAALEPGRVLDQDASSTYGVHFGRGKPYGLGSVTARITAVEVVRASERYSLRAGAAFDTDDAGREQLVERTGQTGANAQLARMLDLQGLIVDGHDWRTHVAYPPAASWDEYGSGPRFDESYRFFGANSGEQLTGGMRPWQPLPTLSSDPGHSTDPSLPIQTDRRERR